MDNMTIIAVASIVTAGMTTGFGTMGPALAEGKAVATALTSSGDDRVHGHLLFRDLDDPDFR